MAIKRYQPDARTIDNNTHIYNLRGGVRVEFTNGVCEVDLDKVHPRAKEFMEKRVTFGIVEEKE